MTTEAPSDNSVQLTPEQMQQLQAMLEAQQSGQASSGGPVGQAPMQSMQNMQDPTQQLLAQLHDLKTPEAIGLWPLAPGWWILGGLVLLIFVGAGLTGQSAVRRSHTRKRHQLLGAVKLDSLANKQSQLNDMTFCQEFLTCLRQIAYTANPGLRQRLGTTFGGKSLDELIQLLDKKSIEQLTSQFNLETLRNQLETALYQAPEQSNLSQEERLQLLALGDNWIKDLNYQQANQILGERPHAGV